MTVRLVSPRRPSFQIISKRRCLYVSLTMHKCETQCNRSASIHPSVTIQAFDASQRMSFLSPTVPSRAPGTAWHPVFNHSRGGILTAQNCGPRKGSFVVSRTRNLCLLV